MKIFRRVAAVSTLSAFIIIALAGCGSTVNTGESNQEREDRLYTQCLDAGGSFYTDDVDFSCVLPDVKK